MELIDQISDIINYTYYFTSHIMLRTQKLIKTKFVL